MKIKLSILCLLVMGLTSSMAQTKKKPVAAKPTPTAATTNANEGIFAEIDTDKGKILLQLEYKKTPVTVANFVALAEGTNAYVADANLKGKPFYNGLKFHRVEDWVIQGGDPTGTGRGGPGYKFADELNPSTESYKKGYVRGTVAMANSGPDTNGSQFFIMHKDTPLPNAYTIFGTVIVRVEAKK